MYRKIPLKDTLTLKNAVLMPKHAGIKQISTAYQGPPKMFVFFPATLQTRFCVKTGLCKVTRLCTLVSFMIIIEVSLILGYFFLGKSTYQVWPKMGWATFWAISQTHLVPFGVPN
jgi:hypothetical protein